MPTIPGTDIPIPAPGPVIPVDWFEAPKDKTDSVFTVIENNSELFRTFASSPAGLILGVVLTPIVGGIRGVIEWMVNLIQFAFFGSGPGTEGQLGLADLPLLTGELIVSAGSGTANIVLETAGDATTAFASFAYGTGPFAPLIYAAGVGLLLWGGGIILRRAIAITLDLVQLGGLIE